MDEALARRILEENVRVHRAEALFYERLHPEIFNWYEQRCLNRDLLTLRRQLPHGSRVLDVGCGTGNVTRKLAAFGYRVTALDISPEMLAILRGRVSAEVELVASGVDAFLAATRQTYDLVCFSSVLHHLPDYRATLVQVAQRLNPGGFLYVTHEPLQFRPKPPAYRYVHLASEYWYTLTLKMMGVPMGTLDYTLSDFHVSAGIVPQELVDYLAGHGLRTVQLRSYLAERAGLAAAVCNVLFREWAACFSFILRRDVSRLASRDKQGAAAP
jgi:2-polyprenyl-3-methyl-5-hydroxy-6-metoxy-1,4-benzoquinol methylase